MTIAHVDYLWALHVAYCGRVTSTDECNNDDDDDDETYRVQRWTRQ